MNHDSLGRSLVSIPVMQLRRSTSNHQLPQGTTAIILVLPVSKWRRFQCCRKQGLVERVLGFTTPFFLINHFLSRSGELQAGHVHEVPPAPLLPPAALLLVVARQHSLREQGGERELGRQRAGSVAEGAPEGPPRQVEAALGGGAGQLGGGAPARLLVEDGAGLGGGDQPAVVQPPELDEQLQRNGEVRGADVEENDI